MKLWFENVWEEENKAIHVFLDECARKWPNKKPFEWYYTRTWKQEDGRTRIDIGSHSEFFIWEGDVSHDN